MSRAHPPDEAHVHRLVEMRTGQVRAHLAADDTAILPCGATEQHGAHLPVGVDTMTAIAVAEDAAERTGALLAPPVWFGWSPHHMAFEGTLSVRPETLSALVEDIMVSLLHHGVRRIVVVNGHRVANVPPLAIATTRVRARTGAAIAVADIGYLAQPEYERWATEEGSGGIGHADGYETAHMLHLHPDLVDKDAVPVGGEAAAGDSMKVVDPNIARNRAAWWPSTAAELLGHGDGASGRPAWGTGERGAALHGALVRDVVALVEELRRMEVDVTRPAAPS